jgi:hypothetical protein
MARADAPESDSEPLFDRILGDSEAFNGALAEAADNHIDRDAVKDEDRLV